MVAVDTTVERLGLGSYLIDTQTVSVAALDEAVTAAVGRFGGDVGAALIGLGKIAPHLYVEAYAKWARGYRQGGINMTNVGLEVWGPEKVNSYEVGAKTSFRGAIPGYFNLAGFYNDFTDQQITANLIAINKRYGVHAGIRITDL